MTFSLIVVSHHVQDKRYTTDETSYLNSFDDKRHTTLSRISLFLLAMYLKLLLSLLVLSVQAQRPGTIEDNATPKVPMEVCEAGENCRKGNKDPFSHLAT